MRVCSGHPTETCHCFAPVRIQQWIVESPQPRKVEAMDLLDEGSAMHMQPKPVIASRVLGFNGGLWSWEIAKITPKASPPSDTGP